MANSSDAARAAWKQNPQPFAPDRYAEGYPVFREGGFDFAPWPKDSGMAVFAKKAFEEMSASGEAPYPPDVYYFALSLRRICALESLGLPADPQSVNVARLVESTLSSKDRQIVSFEELKEGLAAFVLKMDRIRNLEELSDAEKIRLMKLIEDGGYKVLGCGGGK